MTRCFCVPLIATVALFLAGSDATASDDPQFQVNSYIPQKFTDVTWRLDGDFGFSGRQIDREGPMHYDQYLSSKENDSRNISFASYTTYNYVTIPRFFNASLGVFGSGSAYSSESFNDREDSLYGTSHAVGDNDRSRYGFAFSSSLNAGQYLLEDMFVSAITSFAYNYSGNPEDKAYSFDSNIQVDDTGWIYSSINERQSVTDSDIKQHRLNAEITSGWGRLYEGRYAATAMNIVGELRNSGLIEREPSYDEELALTELVYQYRQKHAIDSRLRRIEALDSIISYLHERGIIADPGPYGHLLIQDVWDYFGSRQSRQFGWTVTGGVSYDYSKRKYQSDSDRTRYLIHTLHHPDSAGAVDTLGYIDTIEYISTSLSDISSSPALVVRGRYSRPLSLKWQLDVSAGCKFFFDAYESHQRREITQRTDYTDYYDLYLSVQAEYTYDMRTRITLLAAFDTPNRRQIAQVVGATPLPDFEPPREESSWSLRLGASMTYRISIPTTLSCSLSWDKQHNDWTAYDPYQNDNSSYRFSARISHWLY